MRLYKLDDTVLKLQGNAEKLLQGLSSNSLDKPWNAFLSQHGRIIAVFYQQKISQEDYLLSVPAIAVESLSNHLSKYAKLNHTAIIKTEQKSFLDIDLGQIHFLNEDKENDISLEEFTLYRLKSNLPLMGVDFQADEFILNVDQHRYVSYTKGCFLGQEPVAKVHNRSKPSRKLVVCLQNDVSQEDRGKMTSQVKDPATGQIKGFLFLPNT